MLGRRSLGVAAAAVFATAAAALTVVPPDTPVTPVVEEVSAPAVATPTEDLPATAPPARAPARASVRLPARGERIAAAPDPEPDPEPAPEPAPEHRAAPTVGEGRVVAAGTSTDPIDQGGRRVTWSLEIESATGLDIGEVLAIAEEALYDSRSWARDHELVRIDDPRRAQVRVLIGTPGTVDRLCALAGLRTNGWLSCWNGTTAAINVHRWTDGAREIQDIPLYRRYVVNHEFGHGLGHGHVACAGRGRLADVMQQQTKTLSGCVANPWPYPEG